MHFSSDETDMERSCASCRTLHGVPRRQNRSVAGLVLAEVRSCPGLQLLFVGYGVGELFSQRRMWLCPHSFKLWGCVVPPAPLLTHTQPALYPVVLSAWAVPLLWRSWLTPEQNTWPVPPTRNLLSFRVGVDMGPCVCTGASPAITPGDKCTVRVLPMDAVVQDPILSSCGFKGSCGPILLLASGQLVLGQCVFWSYLPSPVP